MAEVQKKVELPGNLQTLARAVGGILGTITGLLQAEDPGRKTRDQLGKAYEGAVEKANDTLRKATANVTDMTAKVTEDLKETSARSLKEVSRTAWEVDDRLNAVVEKGAESAISFIEGTSKTISESIEKGKKKYKEEKEKLVKN